MLEAHGWPLDRSSLLRRHKTKKKNCYNNLHLPSTYRVPDSLQPKLMGYFIRRFQPIFGIVRPAVRPARLYIRLYIHSTTLPYINVKKSYSVHDGSL